MIRVELLIAHDPDRADGGGDLVAMAQTLATAIHHAKLSTLADLGKIIRMDVEVLTDDE